MEGHIHHQFPTDLEEHVQYAIFISGFQVLQLFEMSSVTVSHRLKLRVLPKKTHIAPEK